MSLTQEYVDSVLGAPKLDKPRPTLAQIKEKVGDTQSVLVGWETVDLLRLLDQFYWDVNSAVDAAHDGKVTKGDDWTVGRGKKNKKSQNKANQKGNQRSRNPNSNQQQRGKGSTNAPRQPGAPPQGYPQRPPQRYPQRGQGQQQQQFQGQQQPQQHQQQHQQQQQQRIPRQQQPQQSQPQQRHPQQSQQSAQAQQRHPQQQQRPQQQHPHHRSMQQQQQHPQQQQQKQQPQQIPQPEAYNAPSSSPAAASSPASSVPGLQGDWAKRAQMKKIQQQQPVQQKLPPQQAQLPPQSQQPPQVQTPSQPQEQPQQIEQPQEYQSTPSEPSAIDPVPEMENLQLNPEAQQSEPEPSHLPHDSHPDSIEIPSDSPAEPSDDQQNEQPVEQNEQPEEVEAAEGSVAPVQVEEEVEPQNLGVDLNEIRGSDPLFLAPGLPGDSDSYQFRFGAYGSEEVEEEKDVAGEEAVVEEPAVEDQAPVESKPEISTDEQQQPTNDQDEQADPSFEDAAGKGQNVNFPNQGSNFENLDQVFYPPYAGQQMPAVFLPNMPQQASHMQQRQDPSAKNPAGVDMTQGMPHLPSHPFPPSPYFSSMYGSHHMMGADQQPGGFPYNPLPSDPNAMSDPRMRYPMLDQNLGYHPGSFPQQHQTGGSQHGSQHVEGQQRSSPPINGNSQYGNGNSNSNSENPKFAQPQSMGHDMNGLQNSQGMNLSHPGASHQGEGAHQGAPQMGHQPPPQQPYPYFLPPFITQYPPMVHPMRGGPFFKGPPSSFPLDASMHSSHGPAGAQSPFFAEGGKGNQQQKHSVLYGHQSEAQEGPYEKAQSPQASSQTQQQQNQGSFQQGGYSSFPPSHMHSFQQPQN